MKKGILATITLLMFTLLITIVSADTDSTIVSADTDSKTDEENVIVNDRGIKMA